MKNLSQTVPNFHAPDYGSRMTSSIYVRGLGARIDQPVIGLNIDNLPVLNKDNFDTELADAERIEVLRGPQSTLYGRNTMGGVVNVYTLSPLTYEGVRLTAEYGSGDSYRFRASSYYKLSPDLGMAVTGYFTHTGGFFDNDSTGEKCDWERLGGGRWKTQWRNNRGVRIDNTFSFSALDQGGYPYAYAGEDIVRDGKTVIRNGQISYNDPSSYRRTTVSDGLTVRYDAAKYSVSSITSYQYSDDEMTLDQDFTPESWFTLRQARREHALTEDIVFRSHDGRRYGWLLGAFGFYRHGVMEAPVHFKRTGIEELIVKNANCEVLPKVSLLYAFDEVRNLYISVAKGYKAGGFNTQMFSDILSEKLKWRMAGSQYDEADLMSYEPEYSWNYELGGHFSCMDGAVRGDFAVFYIDVRDQQLTIFPEGQSTGRMMTNAGRTRSVGAEAALQFAPWRSLEINTAYGYTDARFVRYDNGIEDFKDNRIPYAPQHTLSAQAAWTLPTGVKWLGDVVLQAGVRCAGRIWWNEENTLSQPFYALADASVRFEHKHYSLDIWGRNLGGAHYDVFYFKSIGNEFVQRGRPRTFGITLNINI